MNPIFNAVNRLAPLHRNLKGMVLVPDGDGLHNDHYGFPSSLKFSVTSSEHDPALWVICLFTKLKLAWTYKTIEESELQVQRS